MHNRRLRIPQVLIHKSYSPVTLSKFRGIQVPASTHYSWVSDTLGSLYVVLTCSARLGCFTSSVTGAGSCGKQRSEGARSRHGYGQQRLPSKRVGQEEGLDGFLLLKRRLKVTLRKLRAQGDKIKGMHGAVPSPTRCPVRGTAAEVLGILVQFWPPSHREQSAALRRWAGAVSSRNCHRGCHCGCGYSGRLVGRS